jgi:serine/threonine protein kinase
MDYSNRWRIIGELGQGGQGTVHRVIDASKFNIDKQVRPNIMHSLRGLTSAQTEESQEKFFESFRKAVLDLVRMEDPAYHGALKVLHNPRDARDAALAEDRIRREIQAMSEISHPNLLKIIDTSPDSKWFVSKFYPKGALDKHPNKFAGDFPKALRSFRALVEGVSKLHERGFVHRDIKPQNVFLDSDDNLVLGDFGLVFFTDTNRTRISATWENVGSRDWMPAWAMGMRIEDIRPSFDVFCLGKLLWSMVSGLPILQLWYFDRDRFNVEKMYPNKHSMPLANLLFKECIVENEADCISDATRLLSIVDEALYMIESNTDLISPTFKRRCKVCGIGNYELIVDQHQRDFLEDFGLHPSIGAPFKIFTCNHCGNVQLFNLRGSQRLPAWGEEGIDLRKKRR